MKNSLQNIKQKIFNRLIPGGEFGTIYILIAEDSIEEKWFEKATIGLDKNKINYI